MEFENIQQTIKSLIEKDTALSQFGPVLVEDNVTDLEEPILRDLEKYGVCFALGDVASAQGDSDSLHGRAVISADLQLFVFDNPHVFHAPSGLSLVKHVIKTLIRQRLVTFQNAERFQAEKGGALTIINFSTTCVIDASTN